MKKIALTQGYFAIVDNSDYVWLSKWKWNILKSQSGHIYANRLSYEDGYKYRKRILMHILINKTPLGMQTDHINGNSLDNRKKNLRTVTRSQNMWNRKANRNGTSKYKGVSWHKQHRKWTANIQINKKRIFIGLFVNEDAAALAYVKMAKKKHKKFYKEIKYD